jgi:hypothetical protein
MKKLRMPYFKGKGVDAFLTKFNAYVKSNRVPKKQRAQHLMSACVGDVEALFDSKTAAKWSYKRIIRELQSRYGVTMAVGEMALALKEIKRKDGESLAMFHDRVKQVTKKAPLRSKQLAIEERNGFVEGLQSDLALYLHVQHEDKRRDDISHSLKIARHYEQTQGSAYKVLRDENKKVIEEMRNAQKDLVAVAKSSGRNKGFSQIDTSTELTEDNVAALFNQLMAAQQQQPNVDVNSFTKLDPSLATNDETRALIKTLNDWLDNLTKRLAQGQSIQPSQTPRPLYRGGGRGQRYTFGRGQRARGNFRGRGAPRYIGNRPQNYSYNEMAPQAYEEYYGMPETYAHFAGDGTEPTEALEQVQEVNADDMATEPTQLAQE